MSEFNKYIFRVFSKIKPGATFLSIKNYKNNFGEESNFSVVFNINYINAIKKSVPIVRNITHPGRALFSEQDLEFARKELLDSFSDTLQGFNSRYTCHGVYSNVLDAYGKPIPGLKLHIRENALHASALKIHKTIIKQGSYKYRDKMPITIAKDYLRQATPLKNWVQFKLTRGRFSELSVRKMRVVQ